MHNIYDEIWQLAKPYYLEGRPMDINHIEWMINDVNLICQSEKIDESLLMPLAILHDVGYAKVEKGNPFNLDLRSLHMEKGKIIAEEIMREVGYNEEKANKISYFVSVHDNWALGDNDIYINDKILGTFNDLDFMWMATEKGVPVFMKILNKSRSEMIEYLENNEKLVNRPWSTETTKLLFDRYISKMR